MTMLTAIPRNWFSWDFTLVDEGHPLAEIGMSSWREKGTLTIANQTYRIFREGFFSGSFVLESSGAILARAAKPSAMTRRLIIDCNGSEFELKPVSAFTRKFQLLSRGAIVGTLSPRGFLSRRMNVELSPDLPLPARVFVVWLAVLMWKRESESG
jgi:hypothetical protein